MKRLFYILLFCTVPLGLASCTKDTGSEETRPPVSSAGEVFSLGFERLPIIYGTQPEASRLEKQITSVAVFVETVTGQFYKFLSTEATGSPYAFKSVETYKYDDGVDQFDVVAEVQMEIPYGAERFSRVAVVTNYAVLGAQYSKYTDVDFTDALLAVGSWDELLAVRVPASQVNGVRTIPGLVSTKILDNVDELWNTGKIPVVKVRRLAARLHISVSVWADTGDGDLKEVGNWKNLQDLYNPLFRIHTLSFYNPKQYSLLFPEDATGPEITAIPQFERFQPRSWEKAATIAHYVYPMTGDEAEPLRLYADFSVRAKDTDEWTYYLASAEVVTKEEEICVLKANSAYDFEFKFVFPIDPADLDYWRDKWELNARP